MSTEITTLLNPQTWEVMRQQASVLVQSGLLPSAIKKPEQAIAVMMKGYEIGFPPMQAFSHINIIQGKPCVSAEAQIALIYKNCPGATINWIKIESNGCIIEASRPGGKLTIFKFDEDDAKAAQLLNKDNWKKYPRAMYRSRCVSEMARTMFADSIMGCSYTPEEINPDLVINDNGEILEVTSKLPQQATDEEQKKKQVEEQAKKRFEQEQAARAAKEAEELKIKKAKESATIFDKNNPDHKTKMDAYLKRGNIILTVDEIHILWGEMDGKPVLENEVLPIVKQIIAKRV